MITFCWEHHVVGRWLYLWVTVVCNGILQQTVHVRFCCTVSVCSFYRYDQLRCLFGITRSFTKLFVIPTTPPKLLPSSGSTAGHHIQFRHQHYRMQTYQQSFFTRGICLLNSLPASVVSAQYLAVFRSRLVVLCLVFNCNVFISKKLNLILFLHKRHS